jgi:hypothetical protein
MAKLSYPLRAGARGIARAQLNQHRRGNGLLDAVAYSPSVLAAWAGLTRVAVRSDGFLGWVQPTGAAPCSGPGPLGPDIAPNFDDFGVGCLLLAGSEILRLARPLPLTRSE